MFGVNKQGGFMVRYVHCVSMLDHEGNVLDQTRMGGDLGDWGALRESLEAYVLLDFRLTESKNGVFLCGVGDVFTVTWVEYYVGEVQVDVSELYHQLRERWHD